MKKPEVFNTAESLWKTRAEEYRARADGGPMVRILEGFGWGVPAAGTLARFETTEEGERVLLAAGFKFIPAEKGFRA